MWPLWKDKTNESVREDISLVVLLQEQQEHCCQIYSYRRIHLWLERQGIHHN